ncbi:MAG: beta-lactamase family protein [Candidatus Hydrogenedentes bacterium]|nr:beta-lactamase family protein [Candidatus Hydrogenedentota bacterium]
MPTSITRRDLFLRGAALAVAGAGVVSAQVETAPPSGDLGRLDAVVADCLMRSGVPGLSLAIIRGGRVDQVRGYGIANKNTKKAVTPATVFQAASLTKPMTAYCVMRMVERGAISLDAPVIRYMASPVASNDAMASEITVRTILAHTSGLPNWENGRWPMRMRFRPGESFGYSSEAYNYLQRVVETVTAQPLADALQKEVAEPLGLRETSFVWRDEYEATAAAGYEWDGTPVRAVSHPTEASGAGSLHTTPRDFAEFMLALMASQTTPVRGANYCSVRMMLGPQVQLSPNLAWGLGWGLHLSDDGDRFWHFGDSRGYMSYATGSRTTGSGLVVFTNGRHGLRVAHKVAACVCDHQDPVFNWIYDVFYEGKLRQWPDPSHPVPPKKAVAPRRKTQSKSKSKSKKR